MNDVVLMADENLMVKVRKAVEYAANGDPIKDAIDNDEIVDALRMLVESERLRHLANESCDMFQKRIAFLEGRS